MNLFRIGWAALLAALGGAVMASNPGENRNHYPPACLHSTHGIVEPTDGLLDAGSDESSYGMLADFDGRTDDLGTSGARNLPASAPDTDDATEAYSNQVGQYWSESGMEAESSEDATWDQGDSPDSSHLDQSLDPQAVSAMGEPENPEEPDDSPQQHPVHDDLAQDPQQGSREPSEQFVLPDEWMDEMPEDSEAVHADPDVAHAPGDSGLMHGEPTEPEALPGMEANGGYFGYSLAYPEKEFAYPESDLDNKTDLSGNDMDRDGEDPIDRDGPGDPEKEPAGDAMPESDDLAGGSASESSPHLAPEAGYPDPHFGYTVESAPEDLGKAPSANRDAIGANESFLLDVRAEGRYEGEPDGAADLRRDAQPYECYRLDTAEYHQFDYFARDVREALAAQHAAESHDPAVYDLEPCDDDAEALAALEGLQLLVELQPSRHPDQTARRFTWYPYEPEAGDSEVAEPTRRLPDGIGGVVGRLAEQYLSAAAWLPLLRSIHGEALSVQEAVEAMRRHVNDLASSWVARIRTAAAQHSAQSIESEATKGAGTASSVTTSGLSRPFVVPCTEALRRSVATSVTTVGVMVHRTCRNLYEADWSILMTGSDGE